MTAHELVFFPDYRVANPYQRLLYEHAGAWMHPRPGTIGDALEALGRKGPGGRVVFHLHWDDAVHRNEPDGAAAVAAAQAFLSALEAFADAGGLTLWTLHNAGPHDDRYPEVHAALAARLPELADVVHVHSRAAAAFAEERLGVAPGRIAVVPHGNYLPLHRALTGPQATSRERFGLEAEGRVLLLFGRLGAYKGAADLLGAFARVAGEAADLRLLVAGRQVEPVGPLVEALPAEVAARVHVRDGFVPEEEVEPLFRAADAAVLPYRRILTSGGAMLALSLRRPVVAPGFPALREVLEDERDALLYDPGEADGLAGALRRLAALDGAGLGRLQEGALATARRYDWGQAGLLLDAVLHRLVATRRPRRLAATAAAAGQGISLS